MTKPALETRKPWPGVETARRRIMSANRRRDTGPELRLRSSLHRSGLRFRVDLPIPVPGRRPIRPDVVFTRPRVAIFLDGCFWHGCPEHGSIPKTNAAYWLSKIARNRERDHQTDRLLGEAGWVVVRIWEHESMEQATSRVFEALVARQSS
ncbi:MAG: very short patch repair endonuclease [Actinobacteria bacterium]|nr:very short patch repair endonuclease [Actinomycetota bacterium]